MARKSKPITAAQVKLFTKDSPKRYKNTRNGQQAVAPYRRKRPRVKDRAKVVGVTSYGRSWPPKRKR